MDVKALKAGTISRGITVRDDEVLPGEERVVDRLIVDHEGGPFDN